MSGKRDENGSDATGEVVPLRRRSAKCPVCGKPATERHRPFCSKRCADVDLGRWLNDVYRVPTEEPADPEGMFGEEEE